LAPPGDPVIETDVDVATTDAPQPATAPAREPPHDDEFNTALAEANLRERRALEDIFSHLAAGGELDALRLALLRRWGPRTDTAEGRKQYEKWLRREVTRRKNVDELQAVAGSGTDRQQAQAEAEQAESELARQAPQIQAEIDALRTKLARPENEARRLRSASDARQAAVAELQNPKVLPEFIRDDLKLATERAARDWRAELEQARGRAVSLRGIIAIDPTDKANRDSIRHVVETIRDNTDSTARLRRFYWTSTERQFGGLALQVGELKRDVWDAYIETLRRELADVEATIARLTPLESQAATEIQRLRLYYTPA